MLLSLKLHLSFWYFPISIRSLSYALERLLRWLCSHGVQHSFMLMHVVFELCRLIIFRCNLFRRHNMLLFTDIRQIYWVTIRWLSFLLRELCNLMSLSFDIWWVVRRWSYMLAESWHFYHFFWSAGVMSLLEEASMRLGPLPSLSILLGFLQNHLLHHSLMLLL